MNEDKETRFSTPDKIELRSQEVQEILGRPPRWMISYGISVVFIVIVFIFVGSYFFKYPDVLNATIVVTTENLPVGVIARSSGSIDTLFVKEKEKVIKGDVLALITNTASYKDISILKSSISNFNISDLSSFNHIADNLQLGEVQSTYLAFVKALEDYNQFAQTDYYNKKIISTEKQINSQRKILQKTTEQLRYSQAQLLSAKQLFKMDSTLYAQKSLSRSEFENAKSKYLQDEQSYENSLLNIDNLKINLLQSEQLVLDLRKQLSEQLKELQIALVSSYDMLQTQVLNWEQSYLLVSPCDGIATLTNYWQKNQNISSGDVLITIVPEQETKIIGKIYLAQQGAGKVKTGQTVNIKFANFPYMEYGIVQVKIKNISLVPIVVKEERVYLLEVAFPEKLKTTYGKELAFSQEMQGSAEIITDDLRLLDKFTNPLKAIFKNKISRNETHN
ncbi:MAG: HlyD family efflux transporter periplasmic adaptor subunit [Bacteroidales bacterium]